MPGKIKGLTVELGGETKGLEAAMKDVGKAANDINKELKEVEAGLKFDPANTVLLAQKQELLEQKIAETRKGLDLLRQAEERVEEMFKSGEIDAGQYRNFRREIEKSESKLVTFEKQVRDVEKAQKDAGKTAGEWGDKLKDAAGKAALGAGAAAGAAFSAGFLGAVDVEKASDKLNAQLGATGEDAERYGEVAGNLYAGAWGDSMEDVTNAVGAVVTSIGGMRGASAADLEDITAKVLDFSTAFEVDVPRAAQVAGQMVKSGLADNATEALDLLTRSMQNVPAAVRDDIMDAVDEYGPFLASIGIDGQQAFGLLVKGAERGMYGIDKTGDALKEFTIRATDMSKGTKEAYDILGLSMPEMTRKLLKGGETGAKAFDQIVAALLDVGDPIRQSQAALALFGTPLEDLSVQEIPAFLKGLDDAKGSLGEVGGAVAELGDTLNDNAATQIEAFKRSVQTAFIEKLAAALPHIQGVFGFLTENAAIFVPLTASLGAFALVIGTVAAALKVWSVVQVILNATLWASPITWIVLAVVALAAAAYLLIKNWNKVAGFFGKMWEGIKADFGAALEWIQGAFAGLPGPIQAALAPVIDYIALPFRLGYEAIKTVIELVKAVISGDFGAIPGIIEDALGNVGDSMLSPFKSGYELVVSLLKKLDRATGGELGDLVSTVRKVLAPIQAIMELPFKLGKVAVKLVIDTMTAVLKGDFEAVPGLIKTALGDVGQLLYNTGKAIMQGLLDGIKAAWKATADFLKGVGQKIKDLKGPMDKDRVLLYKEGAAIIAGLGKGMQSQIPNLLDAVSGLSGAIGRNISDGMGTQQQRLQDSWAGLTAEVALAAGGSRYGAVHTVAAPAAAISGPGGPVYHIASLQVVAPNPRAFWKELEAEVALTARAGGRR